MSEFAKYVESKKLTVERIFYSSARLERHDVDDRKLRVQREALRRAGKAGNYAAAGVAKPRSGRGVSRQRIETALAGRPLASAVRAKLTRAVAALSGAAVDAAELKRLFSDVHTPKAPLAGGGDGAG